MYTSAEKECFELRAQIANLNDENFRLTLLVNAANEVLDIANWRLGNVLAQNEDLENKLKAEKRRADEEARRCALLEQDHEKLVRCHRVLTDEHTKEMTDAMAAKALCAGYLEENRRLVTILGEERIKHSASKQAV